jgi:serine/threonine-protein phosphatase 6 regulatory subunit 3
MYHWVHLVHFVLGNCQVLIRLIGADENIYSNYGDTLQWLENTDVLEMIADKFSSSVSYKSNIAQEHI